MKMHELALHMENLFNEGLSKNNFVEHEIRVHPYKQIERALMFLSVNSPETEGEVREFLIKNQGMGDASLDELEMEGYEVEKILEDLRFIYSKAKSKDKHFG